MYCRKCGKEIVNQARFCNYCGSPTENANNRPRINKINSGNAMEKSMNIIMRIASVCILICLVLSFFKPIVQITWGEDYKTRSYNIVRYAKEILFVDYSFEYHDSTADTYEAYHRHEHTNNLIDYIYKHSAVYNNSENFSLVKRDLYFGMCIVIGCALGISILLAIFLAKGIMEKSRFSISILYQMIVLEILKTGLLYLVTNNLTNHLVDLNMSLYPEYYMCSFYIRPMALLVLLYVIYNIYFKAYQEDRDDI